MASQDGIDAALEARSAAKKAARELRSLGERLCTLSATLARAADAGASACELMELMIEMNVVLGSIIRATKALTGMDKAFKKLNPQKGQQNGLH